MTNKKQNKQNQNGELDISTLFLYINQTNQDFTAKFISPSF